jgi:plasmid stabilization system protein ParE
MLIRFDKKFEINFNSILEYIARDKLSASKKFRKDLFKQIKNLQNDPYKFRKSFYFNDENIRDMIFKKYTIVYEINLVNDMIVVLNIFNKNKPL